MGDEVRRMLVTVTAVDPDYTQRVKNKRQLIILTGRHEVRAYFPGKPLFQARNREINDGK